MTADPILGALRSRNEMLVLTSGSARRLSSELRGEAFGVELPGLDHPGDAECALLKQGMAQYDHGRISLLDERGRRLGEHRARGPMRAGERHRVDDGVKVEPRKPGGVHRGSHRDLGIQEGVCGGGLSYSRKPASSIATSTIMRVAGRWANTSAMLSAQRRPTLQSSGAGRGIIGSVSLRFSAARRSL